MLKKYSLVLVLILAVVLSSCTMKYPQGNKPAVTPSPTTRFAATLPGDMAIVESLATGTALALTAAAGNNPNANLTTTPVGGTPLTPGAVTQQTTPMTPNVQITFTSTPIVGGVATTAVVPATTAVGVTQVSGPTSTPVPQGARPATYTLQENEFVYCLARRFNVDPNDILALNGLVDSETIYAGMVLKIPQSGAFPGDRALRTHPASYTVTGNDDTNIYGVACIFGDIDPSRIAQANNLPLSAVLTVGQVLNIP